MLTLLLFALMMDEPVSNTQAASSAPVATEQQIRFFETHVRPLLADHCWKCHGPAKQWAGLRLDSREAILTGGDSGPAAIAGLPDKSLLIKAVRHEDENLAMPQDEKLTELQIQTLVDWIQAGFPYPPVEPEAKRFRDPQHWAFQPPGDVAVPEVKNKEWPQAVMDRFVLAAVESRGLSPAPQADRRTLIRRITFDLTGLPPTPSEVAAFVADDRPEACAELVDRLLDTPAYGEHWGRHWLDVARYADSNGLDENIAHGNAWRYRDYVVRSINSDKPFDQFMTEQLAGDLLSARSEEEREEFLIATGFLSIGPKVLAEVNMPKMRMDIVDEQVDTVGRVFLGMTFGCARCHDHKFDPIDASDYYGLAGIFKSTRTMETYTKVARWHEHPIRPAEAAAIKVEYDAQLAAKKQAIASFVEAANVSLHSASSGQPTPATAEETEAHYPPATRMELLKLREELAALEKATPDLPAAIGVTEDEVADVPIHLRGSPSKLGEIVPRHLPAVMHGPDLPAFPATQSGRLELARWLADPRHPLTSRVLVNRFWRWHFGRGLVSSTDNFGLLGERPSHPELLDWLAQEFIRSGWSLKSFHRMVLLSATYQQSSHTSDASLDLDPENRLWSRFPMRRLAAEELRDSLLFVSGKLDSTLGGSLLKVKNRAYLFDHTSIDTTDYNSPRRSLYLPIIRNNVFELFQLMDFPDPAVASGDRATTTVAPQALMMMNSDFVMESADALAERICRQSTGDTERIADLYAICLGREPSSEECRQDVRLLEKVQQSFPAEAGADADRSQKAWAVLCHVLLASSEFSYVP